MAMLLQATHETDSGRIDARLLREPTGFSLAEIARFIGVKVQTLKSNSSAPSAQPGLAKLVNAWEILQTIFPSDAAIRGWLHHPIRRFKGRTPKWLLESEGIDAFEALVEEMAAGSHG
ncbi:MAG TPA: antitoxin Xre/MbcA/ParS toxin-binding domain-containing protein [Candidatus Tumulicola sp.]|nr:antitoxin Xre/MbcA/ParS toxin-binding domain-containing protein [Candidatus Tumulicola sp.]